MTRFLNHLIITTILVVSGCSNQDSFAVDSFDQIWNRTAPADPRIEQLSQTNTSVLQVAFFEIEATGVLVKEGTRDGYETWLSPEGATLIRQDGFIVGARGLGSGLMASDVSQSRAAVYGRRNANVLRFHSFLTGNDEIETRSYKCVVEKGNSQVLTVVDRQVNTTVMRENCKSIDQAFTNIYWLEADSGRMVQSRQWIGGNIGVVLAREVSVR